jgi:DNA-binding response OmpR family regulator
MARTEETVGFRSHLVLALGDPLYAGLAADAFRKRGWAVLLAHSGHEARRLARELDSPVVVLDTDLTGESGWLTCVKLTQENSQLRVILVASAVTPEWRRFARFVGAAALVGRTSSARALVAEVCSHLRLSAAC